MEKHISVMYGSIHSVYYDISFSIDTYLPMKSSRLVYMKRVMKIHLKIIKLNCLQF